MSHDSALAKKNLELSFEFSRFLLANPTVEASVPENALIVFHVDDDRALTQFNDELAKRHREAHQPIVVVHVKGLASTRLIEPTVSVST